MNTLIRIGRATRAETSKFLTLRSLTGLFAAGMLATIALGWLLGASAKASGENGYDTTMPAPLLVFATLQLGQLLFAAAVALHLTGEYSAEQMPGTLQAVPRRGVLLAAKSIVVLAIGLPQILQLVRIDWVQDLIQYLPTNAATFMATGATEPYGSDTALLVLSGWATVLLGVGAVRFLRSDA